MRWLAMCVSALALMACTEARQPLNNDAMTERLLFGPHQVEQDSGVTIARRH